ncbi:hypothetical protein [Aphanothece microscopica]|uniref:hypothetical protein n=1 Tax=Aphanothece microscopica TaxID=1049561 RepID=UPI003CE5B7E2
MSMKQVVAEITRPSHFKRNSIAGDARWITTEDLTFRSVTILLKRFLAAQMILVAFASWAWISCGSGLCKSVTIDWWNTLLSVGTVLCALYFAYRLLRQDSAMVLTPAFGFAVNIVIFSGLGPLIYTMGPEEVVSYMAIHPTAITFTEVIRAHLLNAVGAVAAVSGAILALTFFTSKARLRRVARTPRRIIPVPVVAVAFLIVGLALKYGLIIPARFGALEIVVPGAIESLAFLPDLGFAAIGLLAALGRQYAKAILFCVWPIHLGFTFLEFGKLNFLTALILPAIGAYIATGNMRRLAVWALIGAATFYISQPIFGSARNAIQIVNAEDTIERATYSQRFEFLSAALAGEVAVADTYADSRTHPWLRLNYVPYQVHSMRMYDRGAGGDTLNEVWMYFIPRLVWPSKPIIVPLGRRWYSDFLGREVHDTSVGITIYGDGYWQAGWLGVIIFSLLTGFAFGLISILSYRAIKCKDFATIPAVFLALQLSILGTSGFFQTTIIGGLVFYVAYQLLISFIKSIYFTRSRPSRSKSE